jgi:hypothetical protein
MSSDAAQKAVDAEPIPQPNLPDPVERINAYDQALQSLAAEERRVRDELATKDPLESTADTLEDATQLLLLVQAIDKIKQERSAAIRRLARGF